MENSKDYSALSLWLQEQSNEPDRFESNDLQVYKKIWDLSLDLGRKRLASTQADVQAGQQAIFELIDGLESDWTLIATHLSGDTSADQSILNNRLKDEEFAGIYAQCESLWINSPKIARKKFLELSLEALETADQVIIGKIDSEEEEAIDAALKLANDPIMENIWVQASNLKPAAVQLEEKEVDAGIEAIFGKIDANEPSTVSTEKVVKSFQVHKGDNRPVETKSVSWTSRIAAAIALLAVVGIGFYMASDYSDPTDINALANVEPAANFISLEDGTKVWLEKDSKLEYPEAFGSDERTVALTGNAYFMVEKDQQRPFRINADGHMIEVLGTAFEVTTDDGMTSVSLVEGSVQCLFNGDKGKKQLLSPKHTMMLGRDTVEMVAWDNPIKYTRFMRHDLSFTDEPLAQVMATIAMAYDIKYKFKDPEVRSRRFTGRFHDKSLEEVMSLIATTLDFKFTIKGSEVIIN
jgi:ferric-dicitrate binding protein FerR (iron transport regulator)